MAEKAAMVAMLDEIHPKLKKKNGRGNDLYILPLLLINRSKSFLNLSTSA
jgi:hypothetical protein